MCPGQRTSGCNHSVSTGCLRKRRWRASGKTVGFTVLLLTHDVEEALLVAGRVIVVIDRPAHIRADLPVPLPYPRHRDDPELVRLRRERLGLQGLPS